MRYAVDPQALRSQARALDQIREELAASRLLGQVDELVLGTPEVASEVRATCRDWSIARGRLESGLVRLSAATARAGEIYGATDDGAVRIAAGHRPV